MRPMDQMSLTQDFAEASFIITGIQPGCVMINNEAYSQSLVVSSDKLMIPWEVTHVDQLNENNLAAIFKAQPEIVLLGTGDQLIFPEPKILALFAQQKIGFETMNTSAVCRTYGILIAEGRKVSAALIFSD